MQSLQSTSKNRNLINTFLSIQLQAAVLESLSAEGEYTTSENILNYILSSYSFCFVRSIPNEGLIEMIIVSVLSCYFLMV
jgi:hypothetical protein